MNAPEPLAREIAVGEERVRYSGHPGRPLVLLLRMASAGMGVWDPVWPALARHYAVAQFDLGMPSREALADPAAVFRRFAQRCVDVAAGLGHARFHVLGWNGGTHVALRCVADHAERVASCTLLGPFFESPAQKAVDKGVDFLRVMLEGGDRELYAYYWFMSGLSPSFVARNFDQVERWVAMRLAGDRFLALDVERAMLWIRALRRRWISDEELGAIQRPTLVVAHSEDRWHAGPSVDMARALHARMPAAQLEVIEGYGSLVLMEAPEAFLAVSEPFLVEQAKAS